MSMLIISLPSPLPLASCDFGAEGVEVPAPRATPRAAEAGEPLVDLAQRFGADGVEAAGPLRPYRRESAVPQHAQMLGHPGLGDAELPLDDRGYRAGGLLAVREKLQDPAPYGIPEDVERVHRASLASRLI
jgi:hypothetical protein